VTLNIATPARPNAFTSVHENDWNYRHVVFRFDGQPIIVQIGQKRIIIGMENQPCDFLEPRENVTSRRIVLSTHTPSTKLSRWIKKVNVVTAAVILCHAYNSPVERCLAMVIGRVLANVSSKLCNFDFILELLLEASIEDFALGNLESIKRMWQRPLNIVLRE